MNDSNIETRVKTLESTVQFLLDEMKSNREMLRDIQSTLNEILKISRDKHKSIWQRITKS